MSKTLNPILVLVSLALFCSCEKPLFPKKDEGTIVLSATGCGWVIRIKEDNNPSSILQTTNIEAFNIELEEGLNVKFKYLERDDLSSVCMQGRIIELTKLTKD